MLCFSLIPLWSQTSMGQLSHVRIQYNRSFCGSVCSLTNSHARDPGLIPASGKIRDISLASYCGSMYIRACKGSSVVEILRRVVGYPVPSIKNYDQSINSCKAPYTGQHDGYHMWGRKCSLFWNTFNGGFMLFLFYLLLSPMSGQAFHWSKILVLFALVWSDFNVDKCIFGWGPNVVVLGYEWPW